jgi:hypothetical protein
MLDGLFVAIGLEEVRTFPARRNDSRESRADKHPRMDNNFEAIISIFLNLLVSTSCSLFLILLSLDGQLDRRMYREICRL